MKENQFKIYCLSVHEHAFFKYLPKAITPLILNDKIKSSNYLNGSKSSNIHHLNKYFGELTGMYWVYKNELENYDNDDIIGFCQNRRLFLDNYYEPNHNIKTNLFSKLLIGKNHIIDKNDTVMISPTYHMNENLYDHFKNNHDEKVMIHGLKILDKENSLLFNKYLQRNYYSICNMFITRVKYFKKYINFIFPILNEILDFCLKENLCKGKNIRLPVFFIERFTSFWFEYYTKVGYLSYAFLNKYFTINLINNSFNAMKTPYSFKFFPTILKV